MVMMVSARERGRLAWFGGRQRCLEPVAGVPTQLRSGWESYWRDPQRAIVGKPLVCLIIFLLTLDLLIVQSLEPRPALCLLESLFHLCRHKNTAAFFLLLEFRLSLGCHSAVPITLSDTFTHCVVEDAQRRSGDSHEHTCVCSAKAGAGLQASPQVADGIPSVLCCPARAAAETLGQFLQCSTGQASSRCQGERHLTF